MTARFGMHALRTGMPVTVVCRIFTAADRSTEVGLEQCKVWRHGRGRYGIWKAQRHGYSDIRLRQEDEGITWCRGHEGMAVDALRVAVALARA
jgi:hypothetical protein